MRRLAMVICSTAFAGLAVAAPAWAASVPSVTTRSATHVAPTSATLNGSVNPRGSGTSYFFQYGTSKSYSTSTAPAGIGSGTRTRSVATGIGGLAGNTTYHFRVVAFNGNGISYGADRTFKTPPIPTVALIAGSPNPVPFGATIVISGRLAGPPNVGGKPVALIGSPWPYTAASQYGNTELTNSDGSYSFVLPLLSISTQFHVVEQTSPPVTSPTTLETVVPRVGLRTHSLGGTRMRFQGTVLPGVGGARALIQIEGRHGHWKTLGRLHTRARGAGKAVYRGSIRLPRTGLYRVLLVPANGAYANSASAPVFLRR